MDRQQTAHLFYNEIIKLHNNTEFDDKEKFRKLLQLLQDFISLCTKKERMQFATQFARIAYTCHKYNVPQQTQWYIHEFRRKASDVFRKDAALKTEYYLLGILALTNLVNSICRIVIPDHLKPILPEKDFYKKSPIKAKSYIAEARVMVLDINTEGEYLLCQDEEVTDGKVKVKYNQTAINTNFNATINAIHQVWKNQVMLNLLEIQVDADGVYYPKVFVIESDYLVDVSAIAYCFTPQGAHHWIYLLKKFMPYQMSAPLMLGNIANFFLDELMSNRKATFKETFPKVFRLNPLAFTTFDNKTIREIMMKSQRHFESLRQMVKGGFQKADINPRECFLEPQFYSKKYGIQGRLDVWYENKGNRQNSAIVELKSGKAYMPNQYGISRSHYTQALLYDLLIKSVFKQLDPRNYILYSVKDFDQLKFAPATKSQQNEAIQVRNKIVEIEKRLIDLGQQKDKSVTILNKLAPETLPKERGFLKRDLALFQKVWTQATAQEKLYFVNFTSFIAREHQLAKIGIEGSNKRNGLAALWLNPYQEKNENFEILSHLTIKKGGNHASEEDAVVKFLKTKDKTNNLANFRVGDIAILYPCNEPERGETALNNQIFKCTVIFINNNEVHIRLRSKQFHNSIFNLKQTYWVVEHDLLDHTFNAMYQGLFSFLRTPTRMRDLLLTNNPPRQPEQTSVDITNLPDHHRMTSEQKEILQKAIVAKDYFLLWGPPGTGKTSVMLKNLVAHLYFETKENILLLAYTNRAVDEICEAIEDIGEEMKEAYIRIGSRYSTAPHFHDRLFDRKIEKVHRRAQLQDIVNKSRIFVATVASMSSRKLLMELKKFDRVIIDEASQILEPVLVGLLPNFKQFILIGDHNQLPAVVAQEKEYSAVAEEALQQVGLGDTRDSLFERLYLRCKANDWDWAYDMLSHQGRMHEHIMDYPNRYFYKESLRILPIESGVDQSSKLALVPPPTVTVLESFLLQHRFAFIPTKIDTGTITGKTNKHEAQVIAQLVDSYCRIYEANGIPINYSKTIGIITPYRAQIAQIKQELEAYNKQYERFSVDTVERYQGSARDIILISLCVNRPQQLDFLVSLSNDGEVDRKLNVALTRARKHLVFLGNENLLVRSPVYRKLVNYVRDLGAVHREVGIEAFIEGL